MSDHLIATCVRKTFFSLYPGISLSVFPSPVISPGIWGALVRFLFFIF